MRLLTDTRPPLASRRRAHVTGASARMRVTSPAPREIWQDLVDRDPDALISQTPAWLDCICAEGRFADASRLYEFASGRRVVLPLARRRGLPAVLSTQALWPFDWGVGGAVTGGEPPTLEEARGVFTDVASQPALRTDLRFPHATTPVWEAAAAPVLAGSEGTTYVLDLAGGFERVWERKFRSSVRRDVRKAQRSELVVEVDTTGRLVGDFYRLYEQSIVRWAQAQREPLALSRWRARRANPEHKFATVAERLGPSCAIWLARLAGEPVAGIIVLRQGRQTRYWRGAMNKNLANPVRANDLLHSLAIEDACAAGCLSYDMGEARSGSSLARFKAGFGATPRISRTYRSERLPISATDRWLRTAVKRAIGFHDA